MKYGLLFWCCGTLLCLGGEKASLTVRAVTHETRVNQRTGSYVTPGTSSTNCSGSANTLGNTSYGTANCNSTSTPAQTHQITTRTLDVENIVKGSDGLRYTIVCRASWSGSNCGPLTDGDTFPAQLDGNTMWLSAHRGGNRGKLVRVKYKILDAR
jgi:hypothetical protein